MSLLSPSESLAFQSFLSSVDSADGFSGPTPTEWLLYTQGTHSASDVHDPKAKDALKKATLRLMSLDTPSPSTWPSFPAADSPHSSKYSFRYPMGRSSVSENSSHQLQGVIRPMPYPVDPSRKSTGPSSSNTPSPASNRPSPLPPDLSSGSSSRPSLTKLDSSSSLSSSSKRSFDKLSFNPTPSSSNKRIRSSPPLPSTSQTLHHFPSPSSSPSAAPAPRPALLSASQKRANHIQSEQKRRANIRKGYEALCETVPALREAIRKEEEEEMAAARSSRSGASEASNGGKGRKKKGKGPVNDDKIDGRAGPKSENIVLQKTVDYIQELNSAKEGLLRRLQRARSLLPPGHPVLYPTGIPQDGLPLWEREWNGGLGDDDEGMGSDEDGQ